MKTKQQIKDKIIEHQLKIKSLKGDENKGWSNNSIEIDVIQHKINVLLWVIS